MLSDIVKALSGILPAPDIKERRVVRGEGLLHHEWEAALLDQEIRIQDSAVRMHAASCKASIGEACPDERVSETDSEKIILHRGGDVQEFPEKIRKCRGFEDLLPENHEVRLNVPVDPGALCHAPEIRLLLPSVHFGEDIIKGTDGAEK